MGHLIRKNSLAVNEILNRVNSEKTYFVYTDKGVRILKLVVLLLLAFVIGNRFYQPDADVVKLRPVDVVTGKLVFGAPLKDVDLIDLSSVRSFMKKRTSAELKIKGLVSTVAANGQLEMILDDGSLLKVNHQMKIEEAGNLAARKVVMAGKLYKTADKATLIYDADSLTVL
ncbi:hypothetical protein OQX61_19490 [Pedobacter sp. PLR]|uniref:hypothetical protein n=1 Tax=Pedobacter sp. PLR TaxID=2994465 RepID=UPI002248301F|nr:hypothetical protein [Pedobacter sp. PLR]MCX2453464.1 hypothetical protein [Pedobacter sp. PLR]